MYREGACETSGIRTVSFITEMRNAEAARHQISLGFEKPPEGALPDPLGAAGLGGLSGLEPRGFFFDISERGLALSQGAGNATRLLS